MDGKDTDTVAASVWAKIADSLACNSPGGVDDGCLLHCACNNKSAKRPSPIVRVLSRVSAPEPARLHIYDVGRTGRLLNKILQPLSLGMFHCGVEVFGMEWSFSETPDSMTGTGVFSCLPGHYADYAETEIISLGDTKATESDVRRFITMLEEKWSSARYDVLYFNCLHFCRELCAMLGVRELPPRLTNLVAMGAQLDQRLQALLRPAPVACCMCVEEPGFMREIVDLTDLPPVVESMRAVDSSPGIVGWAPAIDVAGSLRAVSSHQGQKVAADGQDHEAGGHGQLRPSASQVETQEVAYPSLIRSAGCHADDPRAPVYSSKTMDR